MNLNPGLSPSPITPYLAAGPSRAETEGANALIEQAAEAWLPAFAE